MKIIGADEEVFNRRRRESLWIGCSDYPLPANAVNGAAENIIFHDNIANLITPTDLNCLAAMEFAVDVRGAENIVVCGHYECRGIELAIDGGGGEMLGNWLKPIAATAHKHETLLSGISDRTVNLNALCELNVIEQVLNVCRTSVIGASWRSGGKLSVSGLIYNERDNLISDLNFRVENEAQLWKSYRTAISSFKQRRF